MNRLRIFIERIDTDLEFFFLAQSVERLPEVGQKVFHLVPARFTAGGIFYLHASRLIEKQEERRRLFFIFSHNMTRSQ